MNEELELEEVLEVGEKELQAIKDKAEEIKKEKNLKNVFPVVIAGDEYDDKDQYVVYLKEPSFKEFSRFSSMGKSNEMQALRMLATDCYVGGDKCTIDNDSLFMGGLMTRITSIVRLRQTRVINLSGAGKSKIGKK